jgi:hypothetical protein
MVVTESNLTEAATHCHSAHALHERLPFAHVFRVTTVVNVSRLVAARFRCRSTLAFAERLTFVNVFPVKQKRVGNLAFPQVGCLAFGNVALWAFAHVENRHFGVSNSVLVRSLTLGFAERATVVNVADLTHAYFDCLVSVLHWMRGSRETGGCWALMLSLALCYCKCVYTYLCVCVCVRARVCVPIYIYIYICIYKHTHTYKG